MRVFIVDIGFQFEAIWQDNDVIEVRVLASNGIFCGRADVYVGIGQLEESSARLRGFPTIACARPACRRGVVRPHR